jgi:hypothetical protein
MQVGPFLIAGRYMYGAGRTAPAATPATNMTRTPTPTPASAGHDDGSGAGDADQLAASP